MPHLKKVQGKFVGPNKALVGTDKGLGSRGLKANKPEQVFDIVIRSLTSFLSKIGLGTQNESPVLMS